MSAGLGVSLYNLSNRIAFCDEPFLTSAHDRVNSKLFWRVSACDLPVQAGPPSAQNDDVPSSTWDLESSWAAGPSRFAGSLDQRVVGLSRRDRNGV